MELTPFQNYCQHTLCATLLVALLATTSSSALELRKRQPYLGAIVVEAQTGEVLFADCADEVGYPASATKMMTCLVLLGKIATGEVRLDQKVEIGAESARIGGSQVYLAEGELFSVDDLLYALMVKSANDAARALALAVSDTRSDFVRLMNLRARTLGLDATKFQTEHGLPPGPGQKPDLSTARDLARLARELIKYEDALRYSATKVKKFRGGEFILRTHNKLIETYPGCDGLKTGFFNAGGWSIVATAKRDGERIIAVLLGCSTREGRNSKAAELLDLGFQRLSQRQEPRASE